MSDLAALEAQLADLCSQVAALRSPASSPTPPAPAPVAPRPVKLHTLVGGVGGYLHRDVRVVRQLAQAVALCRGAPVPADSVPADFVPLMRTLAEARAAGRSWRHALAEAGLEVPVDLTDQAQAVRLEIDQLWGRVLPLAGLVLENLNSVARISLSTVLKRLLA